MCQHNNQRVIMGVQTIIWWIACCWAWKWQNRCMQNLHFYCLSLMILFWCLHSIHRHTLTSWVSLSQCSLFLCQSFLFFHKNVIVLYRSHTKSNANWFKITNIPVKCLYSWCIISWSHIRCSSGWLAILWMGHSGKKVN